MLVGDHRRRDLRRAHSPSPSPSSASPDSDHSLTRAR
jgi:hypothetical protein